MSTTTMRGLNKAELKMNLVIPPFRRSNNSTGGAAFPSVLLPVTASATATTSATGPAATAAGGGTCGAAGSSSPSDGLGIRGLSSEPPVARPTKRRNGNQELLERETSRARTRSPEVLLSAGGHASRPAGAAAAAAGGAQASSSTSAAASSSSSSSKSPLPTNTNSNASTGGSNKRARTSLSVSHGSTIDSLASVASEALQTFPIPNPSVLSQSAGASSSSSGAHLNADRRPATTRRPSLVSRGSMPSANNQAAPSQEDSSGSRSPEPTYANKAGTSSNNNLDTGRESKSSPSSLSQRRGDTAAGKGLKIATLAAAEVVEQAPRTAPGKIVTGPLGPSAITGQVSGKGHGRRGTSFNGQGQFMAHANNSSGGPHASLPTPLQAIPVSPYTVQPFQPQSSLYPQSHSHAQGPSHSHSHSRHAGLPPLSSSSLQIGSNPTSATRHGSVSGAPVLDLYYAPTVTGTYSVPIPHPQQRSSISSTPGSIATYLPPHQTAPPPPTSSTSAPSAHPFSSSSSTSFIMETGKHAFLAHFSTLYDVFHETRTLSRSLDHELGRARTILNQLDEGWIDTLVRRENERLWNRVIELERVVEDERRLWRDRLGRLERAVLGDAHGLSSATSSSGPSSGGGLGLGSAGSRRGSDSLGGYTLLPTMGLGIGHEESAGGGSSAFARGMEGQPGGLEMNEGSSGVRGGGANDHGPGPGPGLTHIKRERGGTPLPPLMTTGSLVMPRRRSVLSRPGTATSSTSSGSMNEFGTGGGGGGGGMRNGMSAASASATGNSTRSSSMNTSQGPRGEDV